MIDENRIVYFWEYCNKCKYEKNTENEQPCDECLDNTVNINSHKPVCFEPEETKE